MFPNVDREARFVIGLILIGFAPAGWNWLGWIGVVPLATAIGSCPLYILIGVSACSAKRPG